MEVTTKARERRHRPSYTIVDNIDAALSQLVRLIGHGYHFVFYAELKHGKDPAALDEKLIDLWDLDQPGWKRESRRRGKAPSIWYLRYREHYFLLSTKGRSVDEHKRTVPHPFFLEYGDTLVDVQRYALYFCGYSIRYPRVHGVHQLNVSLEKRAYEYHRDTLLQKSTSERYRTREAMEAEFAKLPHQPYRLVLEQYHRILRLVNKRRARYRGFEPAREECIPDRIRVATLYDRAA